MKLKKSILNKFLILYVFFLYTAQETLIPEIVHSIVMYAMIFLTALFVVNKMKLTLSDYTKWYAALAFLCLFSFIYADNMTTSSLYTMGVILIITFCVIYIIEDFYDFDRIVLSFIISADALGVLLIATGQAFGNSERLGESVSGNANIFSQLLMVSAIFALWMALYKKKGKMQIFCLSSFAFQMLMMFLSGGRKTIIAVVACFALFFVFKEGRLNIGALRNILIAFAALIVMYYAVMKIDFLYNAVGERFEALFSFIGGGKSSVSSDSIRKRMIEIAIDAWKRKPVFGYGFDNFRFYNAQMTGRTYYAHNNFAELLYDLGIAGFGLYYSFVAYIMVSIIRLKGIRHEYKMLCIGLITELLIFEIGGVSYYQVLPQLIVCLAFVVLKLGKSERKGS